MPVLPREVTAALVLAAACAAWPAQATGPEGPFAVVGDAVITASQYEAALQSTVRQKFYHRQVPESQRRELEREVAENLIERALLVAECRRRGMVVEGERLEAMLGEYDKRYAASAVWQAQRATILPLLKRELEERELVERLRAEVNAAGEPSDEDLRAYYESHADLFIEPEQSRLSIITLKVDPGSARAAWESAEREAQDLRRQVLAGADFAALGGTDLGYRHHGMLPEPIGAQLAALSPGQVSEPIRVLEGIALVELTERKPARQQPLDEARVRAAQLWQREQAAQRWKTLVASLRSAATIRIDLARYPALAGIAP